MKFIFTKIFFIFLFIGLSNANENIRFIDINYIVNNSEAGKALKKIVENKRKTYKRFLISFQNKGSNSSPLSHISCCEGHSVFPVQ